MFKNLYLLLVILISPTLLFAQADIKVTINGAEINSGASVDLGDISVLSPISNVLYIENVGDASLIFGTTNGLSITGTDASIYLSESDLNNKDLAPGEFTVLNFTVEPTSSGLKNATITLNTNDADESSFAINLSANVMENVACESSGFDMETFYSGGIYRGEGFFQIDTVGVTYYQAPTGWSPGVSLLGVLITGDSLGISMVSDSRSGTSAVRLVNGDNSGADLATIIPCSSYPETFSGYYKYSGDAYRAYVILSTGGADSDDRTPGNTDTLYIEDEETLYTLFEMPIPYDAQSVDTIFIDVILDGSISGDTELLLDDLALSEGVGVSTPFQPAPVTFTNVSTSSFDVEWEAPNDHGASITGYTLEEKVDDGSYSSIYSGTDLSFSRTNAVLGSNYYYRVKATNSEGDSPYSEEVFVTLNDDELIRNGEVTRCDFTFTDSGGRSGDYSSNESFEFTINPTTEGEKVKVSFSSFNVDAFELFYVYDGPDRFSPFLVGLAGNGLPDDIYATSETGQLTFVFETNSLTNKSGWQAEVSCVTPSAPSAPSPVTFSEFSETSAVVSWLKPTTNGAAITSYTLEMKNGVTGSYSTVYTGSESSYTATGLSLGETYYFRVKASNAIGESLFSDENSFVLSEEVVMTDGTIYSCALNFYDSGKDSNYANDEDFTLTVKPTTPGKLVKISFEEFDVESDYDYLKIYDGPDINSDQLANLDGASLPLDFLSSSSGGELTFRFTSDDYITKSGWKALITCELGPSTTWLGEAWDNGEPTATLNAIIASDYEGAGFTCANLTISSGASLSHTGTLEVKGDIINNGSMTITSGNSLITYDIGDVADNIVIERNTRYADGRYSFVGTPVKSNSEITGSDLGSHVYRYDEGASSDPNSLSRWVGASSDVLVPGQGYTQASQQLISFTGEPNSGEIIYGGLHVNDGWHLVSNPYPAAITIDEFLAENTVTTDAIYIWDDNGSDEGRGSNSDYIVANLSGATDSNGPDNDSRWNGNIGSMQGFMMQFDGTAGEIVFTESMRVNDNNSDDNFFRKSSVEFPKVRINLSHPEGLFRQALVAWNEGVSDDKLAEGFDAKVFRSNSSYGVSTVKANTSLAIQAITSERKSIPLTYNVEQDGNYTIQLDHKEAQGYELLLADHATGDVVDARLGYSFHSKAGQFSDRFELVKNLNVLGAFDKQLQVYASERILYVQLPDNQEREFKVFSLSGQLVLNTKLDQSAQINMSVPSGVYMVTDGEKTFKVVLK